MTHAAGTKLGLYEILSPLGAGVSAAGQRFFVGGEVGEAGAPSLTLGLDWTAEERKK